MKETNEDRDIELDERSEAERRPRVVTRDDIQNARESRETRREPEPAPREPAQRERGGLFEPDRASELQRRWTDVQARFVDDPREAVKSADGLVDEVIRDLSTLFSDERTKLEGHWSKDQEVSTEDLRVALRRYRSFFERLLSL